MRSERLDPPGLAVGLWLLASGLVLPAPAARQRTGPERSTQVAAPSGVVAIGWAPRSPERPQQGSAEPVDSQHPKVDGPGAAGEDRHDSAPQEAVADGERVDDGRSDVDRPSSGSDADIPAGDSAEGGADDRDAEKEFVGRLRAGRWKPAEYTLGVVLDDHSVLTPYHGLGKVPANEYAIWDERGLVGTATVRAADPWSDLAVLDVQGDRPLEPLAWSEQPGERGQPVRMFTDPLGLARDGHLRPLDATIADVNRTPANVTAGPLQNGSPTSTIYHLGGLWELEPPPPAGSSGAPLLDERGKLVGLVTSAAAMVDYRSHAGYAIPADAMLRRVVERLREGQEAEYGFLGVALDLAPAEGPGGAGVRIGQVVQGTPAHHAGLLAGDRITQVDGQAVQSADHFLRLVGQHPPGTRLVFQVQRQEGLFRRDAVRSVTVELWKKYMGGTRPAITTAPAEMWQGIAVEYPSGTPDFHRFVSRVDPRGCVVVVRVEPSSAGWQSGVRPGMLIAQVDGRQVRHPSDFFRYVAQGQGAALTLVDGTVITVSAGQ